MSSTILIHLLKPSENIIRDNLFFIHTSIDWPGTVQQGSVGFDSFIHSFNLSRTSVDESGCEREESRYPVECQMGLLVLSLSPGSLSITLAEQI